MSALARYFHTRGLRVSGYDRTPSPLTKALETEGISIQYTDEVGEDITRMNPKETLVVLTPAVPADQPIYRWLREHGYDIRKRSEVLGLVTRQLRALCVAGTHGKTTTSTLLAHLLHESKIGTNAFLGGISQNYGSNLLLDPKSDLVVVEADEYDRSFHRLTPYMSVITSIEPDHLDIYGTAAAYQESFDYYASLVSDTIVLKKGFELHGASCRTLTYSGCEPADFYADRIRVEDGAIRFDLHSTYPKPTVIRDMQLGVPVWVNIENAVAAMSIALMNGVSAEELKAGLASFRGVYRRFNIHLNTPQIAYIDDYAHHPTELNASIESIRKIYPQREAIGIFQPHLFTRTRDFADDFAAVLSQFDRLILLPVYPARELPIAGVNSEWLMEKCRKANPKCEVEVVEKANLTDHIRRMVNADEKAKVVMSLGAGDIDRLVGDLTRTLQQP